MKHGLFRELKRRHVYRVAVAYAVVGWLLIEVATQVFPFFHVPNWSIRLLVLLVVAGFPVAIILAWAFEVTPDGVRRTESAESAEARAPEQHRRVGRKLDYTIISVLALALVLALWRPWSSHPAPAASASTASPADAAPGKSIAVLPFENLSNDKTNAYFADGMQDLILTKLADIGELKVISRTSTMQYGSHPRNLKQIGKDLGVATILEGSVQKAGDQVLINVQLINAQTDAHIWAESYQRTLKNIFGVEGEVAGKIAKSLAASLSPSETKRLAHTLSTNPAANDLYLQADYFAHAGILNVDTAAFGKAIPLYRKAIEMAPDFARARAQLSITESMLAWFGGGGEDVKQLNADAQAQARQALSLAPEMTAARLAAGYVNYYGHGAYAAALKDFDAALELRPNDAKVLRARSYVQRRLGHYEAAIASQQKAFELDPRNSTSAFDLGLTYMALYRYAEAKKYLQRALALDPNNYQARSYYAFAIYYSGGEASRALKEVQGLNPGEGGYFSRLVRWNILIYQRRYQEALAAVEAVPDKHKTFRDSSVRKRCMRPGCITCWASPKKPVPCMPRPCQRNAPSLHPFPAAPRSTGHFP